MSSTTDDPQSSRSMARAVKFALLAIFLIILFLLWRYPVSGWMDNNWFSQQLVALGWLAAPAFYLFATVFTAFGLPRQLMAFIGGYTFGVFAGLVIATLAAISGCFLCFSFSRRYLSKWVAARYPQTTSILNGFVQRDAFLKIVILRLQPFGTNLITNLCAGVSKISARAFIASSLLGYIPQMLVFALLGSGIRVRSETQTLVSVALFVISVVLGLFLVRKYRLEGKPQTE